MLIGPPVELGKYVVDTNNKKYGSWQQDSLAVHIYSIHIILQKLNYFLSP